MSSHGCKWKCVRCDTSELVCIRARNETGTSRRNLFTRGIEAEGSRQNHGAYVGEVNVSKNMSRKSASKCLCKNSKTYFVISRGKTGLYRERKCRKAFPSRVKEGRDPETITLTLSESDKHSLHMCQWAFSTFVRVNVCVHTFTHTFMLHETQK